jgi:hypothetical protein
VNKRLLLALAFACAPAFSAPMFESGELTVTFTSQKCELAAIGNFLKQYGPEPKKAAIVFKGHQIRGCYVVDTDGDYVVVDEMGSGGVVPAKAVKPGV